MLWKTLFNRIGKQPLKFTQHNHVYALLENPATHRMEKVWLELKYDAYGHPYLIQSRHNDAYNKIPQKKGRQHAQR